jgi:predicted ATPase
MLEPGQIVSHYKILECLGTGAMGVVYGARDLKLDRPVALKFLTPSLSGSHFERERLLSEARTASRLNHPGICVIYDVEEVESSETFIVMELIVGSTLSRLINQRPVPIPEVLSISMQIARAIEAAHLRGILHRDIKSANVMVDAHGRARVMDFGLAVRRDPARPEQQTGEMGTLAYTAPELIQGRTADERSDMYSFGVILYEMLTGHVPFCSSDPATVTYSILTTEPEPVEQLRGDVPHSLAATVERLLKKDPSGRYADMSEVIAELSRDQFTGADQADSSNISVGASSINNFPAFATRFLGRQKHIKRLRELLESAPLLTLTGPGGTGKTRLAVQVARAAASSYPDGLYFIPLASISDPALVPSAVAQVLKIRESEERTLQENLLRRFRDWSVLLVLDNFEHVLGAARFVHDIVAAGPLVRVIVTSRSPLHIGGEVEYPVPPMELPDPRKTLSLGTVAQSEAACLFAREAAAAKPGFALTSGNASVVAAICARVDGLPLAIELAASRTGLLSPQAILSRLDHRMKLLKSASPALDARQRTLRASIAWSYDLLDASEKKLFNRLSVFVGGFTLTDAEAIVNLRGDLTTEVLDGVQSLATKSLVQRLETAGPEPRFLMLETIREFGLECLESTGELKELRKAHAEFFLQLVRESEDPTFNAWDIQWVDRLRAEAGNIRAALENCRTTGDIDVLVELVGSTWYFWNYSNLISEGLAWADHALAASGSRPSSRLLARVLHTAGYLALLSGDFEKAKRNLQMSLAALEEQRDDRTKAEVFNTFSLLYMFVYDHEHARAYQRDAIEIFRRLRLPARVADCLANDIEQEDDQEARRLYVESLETFRNLGNTRGMARLMRNIGFLFYRAGNHATFKQWLLEALPLHREVGDLHLLSHLLNYLGDVSRCDGDFEAARQWYAESKTYSAESGFRGELAWSLTGLGFVSLEFSEESSAQQFLLQALDIRIAENNRRGIAECLMGLSSITRTRGDPDRAVRMLGAVEAALATDPGLFLLVDQHEFARSLEAAHNALAPEQVLQFLEEGRRLSLAQALALFPDLDLLSRMQLLDGPRVR